MGDVIVNGLLTNIGILAVAIAVIIIVKGIDDFLDDRRVGAELSEKIIRAAKSFSEGASEDEIRALLLDCIDLDEDDIDEILELSISSRIDDDGGYGAFIKITKSVLRNY
jgi:hypothetical protein